MVSTRTETSEKVLAIVAEVLDMPPRDPRIREEACLFDDLGGDSLDAVEVVVEAEEAFGITLDEEADFELARDPLSKFVDRVERLRCA